MIPEQNENINRVYDEIKIEILAFKNVITAGHHDSCL
jgi:hypothetical protein